MISLQENRYPKFWLYRGSGHSPSVRSLFIFRFLSASLLLPYSCTKYTLYLLHLKSSQLLPAYPFPVTIWSSGKQRRHTVHPHTTWTQPILGYTSIFPSKRYLTARQPLLKSLSLPSGSSKGATPPTLSPPLSWWKALCAPSASRCAIIYWNASRRCVSTQPRLFKVTLRPRSSAPPVPSI